LQNVYITEKVDRKTGCQFICLDEEWTRGYIQEIQDFMECVVIGREPRAGLDLAFEAIRVQYAGYWAAWDKRLLRTGGRTSKPCEPIQGRHAAADL
jgi:hypothetical protein